MREVPFGAASSVLALNAVYFKGLWLIPFEKGLTQEEDFKLLDGTTRKVPMMRQDGDMAYDERKGAQIVRVPYQGTMSMLIVLPPKKTPFGEFCASLRQTLATDWTRSRHRRPGSVRLPRFRIESDLDLSGALAGIGIRRAFERNVAEFGGISDAKPPLFLGRVRQKGFVEVNEKGTEAAAVTVAFIPLAAKHSVARRSFTMIVDRPFVFAICDNLTGAVVFLGTVVDPA